MSAWRRGRIEQRLAIHRFFAAKGGNMLFLKAQRRSVRQV
jgi:hypothetical protein